MTNFQKVTITVTSCLTNLIILGVIWHQTITVGLPIGVEHPEYPFTNPLFIATALTATLGVIAYLYFWIRRIWQI